MYPQQLLKAGVGGWLQLRFREGNSGNQVCSMGQCLLGIIVHSLCFLKACFYPFVWKYEIKYEITQRTNSWNEGDPTPLHLPKGRAGTTLTAFIPSWFNMKPHREKPSPSGPRNLRGEAGESLQETMDVLRDREKRRRKNMKNILSVIWLFFCEGGATHNFTDQNSSHH